MSIGEKLLKKTVININIETGSCDPTDYGTNEDALKKYVKFDYFRLDLISFIEEMIDCFGLVNVYNRFAQVLSKEKLTRDKRSPHPKRIPDQLLKPDRCATFPV